MKPINKEALSRIGKDMVKVYRGLSDTEAVDLAKPLGVHWTTDINVARNFTGSGPLKNKKTIIIEAHVNKNDIEKGPERFSLLQSRDYRKHEKEVAIKPGSKLKVVQVIREIGKESGPYTNVPAKHPLFEDTLPEGGKVRINPGVRVRKRTRKFPYPKTISID